MENSELDSKIQDLKASATDQTEFVHGLLMYLMIQTKAIDDIIENYGNAELKEVAEPFRQAIPEYCMALAVEIGKIHEGKNVLS